jgi:endonuclease/exonuclease/phosphatase family metal-dependent hydrolase
MTYNAHGCVGTDKKLDIERTARVVAEQRPQLLAIQEIDVAQRRSQHVDQAADLARRLDMQAHFTCAFEHDGGKYGIAMMAKSQIRIEREGCLPTHGDEVRAAQWAQISVGSHHLNVVHTHLSVRLRDRNAQLDALIGDGWIQQKLADPHLLLLGDLNALPCTAVYRALSRRLTDVQRLGSGRRRATWPSRWPIARVDHIFVGRGFRVVDCRVPKTPLTVRASDHLPLVQPACARGGTDSDRTGTADGLYGSRCACLGRCDFRPPHRATTPGCKLATFRAGIPAGSL